MLFAIKRKLDNLFSPEVLITKSGSGSLDVIKFLLISLSLIFSIFFFNFFLLHKEFHPWNHNLKPKQKKVVKNQVLFLN